MSQFTSQPVPVNEFEDKAYEEAMATAEYFARKSSRLLLSNPNENLNQDTPTFSRYTKEQIMSFMQSPASSAKQLRDASIYMADVSTQYDRLLSYYSNLYVWAYMVSPVKYSGQSSKTMAKSYWDSLAFLEALDLPHVAPIVEKTALREGVFYGVVHMGANAVYVQRIPPDYCKLTHIIDGTWGYSVDMSKIPEKKLGMYPKEFTSMWNAYKEGKGKWQEVPSRICFCIKADETKTNYSIPPFASTLGLLYDIEQYKALQKTGAEIDNYKLLHMIIPMNTDGTPQVNWKIAEQYYKQVASNLPPYIGLSISPMQLKDYTFERSGAADQVDIVARSEDNYWSSNGSSALLHGSSSGKTAGTLKLSIKADEAFVKPMIKQIETLVNKMLREIGTAQQKYRITVLPVTVFNQDEMLKTYKEAATLGVPGAKSAYASMLGVQAYDVLGLNMTENDYLKMDELTPLRSGYTIGSNSGAGAPSKSEDDLTESGEATRDTSANDNR